jgi:non-ribosomal peptide synthetase-like protein
MQVKPDIFEENQPTRPPEEIEMEQSGDVSSIGEAPDSATRYQLLHELFESQADARPRAIAVTFGREKTTYTGLEQRANRMARYLFMRGTRRGSLVAMLLPRSLDAYATLLGILKSGAAYVPIDPDYPADRVAYILENSGTEALVTTAELAERQAAFSGPVIRVDADRAEIDKASPRRLPPNAVGVRPGDLCYIIYTSGSTGRPKGVMIEHRSAWHLAREETRLYGVRPTDRIYQGASLAFDLSVEEIWLAFNAGATLVSAPREMTQAGPDLARLLAEQQVTVLSCVPTLLSILSEDVPSLRLLILGGETCHERLVQKWARPGRRMLNTYGPTETTVIATCAELVPGKPVTIGRAIPGYRVYLLDPGLRPIASGETGEIWIGGVGVARGYVGLPGSTEARFVPDPFAGADERPGRIYRTGDLGRFNDEGDLEFLGRCDGQVKLRGFRIELAEIESVMMEAGGVRAAACAVREDAPGVQQLVGYIVPGNGAVDEEQLRAHLRNRLPSYMTPALIETVADLPKLPSGKLDRASLPAPRARAASPRSTAKNPQTETEQHIAELWKKLFHPQSVSKDDDFFLDLGGHSLLAALMVSELRKEPRFARVSVTDVYQHPTVGSLAAEIDARAPGQTAPAETNTPSAAGREERLARERARHFRAGVAQSAGLYFVFGFKALQWITPYLVFFLLHASGSPALKSAAWAALSALLVFPTLVLVTVAVKWLLLGRLRPGRHPLWGVYYLRWWLAQTLVSALHLDYLGGTPLLPFVYRLLGARIGKDVHLTTDRLAAFDLISIGDGACVDDHASVLGYTVEDGELIVGPVRIGRGCFVGTRAVLSEGSVMEDEARLEDLSFLPRDARIPRGETWAGSPARPASGSNPPVAPPPKRGPLHRAALAVVYAALFSIIPIVLLSAVAPGVAFLVRLDLAARPFQYLATTPLVGGSFVLLITAEVILLKWLLVGRVRAGTHPVHGSFYIRNWMVEQLLKLSLDYVGQLHATLYLAPWYRALGARLGKSVELSTASTTTPDLLEIGDGGTVADEVSLGSPRIEGGWMFVAPTRLGRRAFIGNSAVVPAGTVMGDGSLVGVLSLAPSNPGQAAHPGTGWLGSPPIALPRREPSAAFSEDRTFRPSRKRRLARAAFELLRVTLPPAGFIMVTAAVITAALELWGRIGLGATLLLMPGIYAAGCALVAAMVALVKWAVMGRYRPFVRPLWSGFVWRLELVNALYEFLATPLVLEALQGTPLLPWYLRLLGARIGRRVYIRTTGFLEWDLVEIGDRAALNEDCILQTHLFEDRVLKASKLRIGADCVVGRDSVALYDSEMENASRLDALSLLMKGERLPAGTTWAGSPAVWQKARPAAVPAQDFSGNGHPSAKIAKPSQ